MRLDAERGRAVILCIASAAIALAGGGGCVRSWMLGPDSGGAGGGIGPGGAAGPGGGAAAGSQGVGGQDAAGGRGGGGFPGSGGLFGSGGHNFSCPNPTRVPYDIPTTEMIFLVGRDASMATKFGDGTRMSATQAAVQAIVASNETAINFGYQDFPSLTGTCSNGDMCCPSNDFPVYPGALTAAAIDHALHQCGLGPPVNACVAQTDSRPVAQALTAAATLFNAQPDVMNDREIVLVVDGPPGCVGQDSSSACLSALMAISTLNNAAVKTYVIGVGETAVDEACLLQIALAGQTSVPLFDAGDQVSLSKALTQIVTAATDSSCTIKLHSKVDPTLISVLLQGREIPFDSSGRDGWSFVAGSSVRIQVHGLACRALQSARSDEVVWSGCPPCGEAFPCPH